MAHVKYTRNNKNILRYKAQRNIKIFITIVLEIQILFRIQKKTNKQIATEMKVFINIFSFDSDAG